MEEKSKYIDMDKYFSEIYRTNHWKAGNPNTPSSGEGSSPEKTKDYIKHLEEFINSNNIKSIIDYGCGDWAFSHLINWGDIKYMGVDCVESVISDCTNKYSTDNIIFKYVPTIEKFYDEKADLLIIKEVFIHWTCDEIVEFLKNVKNNFKYIWVANSFGQKSDWQDTPLRSRPLSSTLKPLSDFNAKRYRLFDNNLKEISIISQNIG